MNAENAKWLWFDLDGTLADFYNVDGWLADLQAYKARPYEIAKPLYQMDAFTSLLRKLKRNGYCIGVVSWLSKCSNKEFDEKVISAKQNWLKKYGLASLLDETLIVSYGTSKSEICKKYGSGILIDDEKQNRDNWKLGETIDAQQNIVNILARL
jgi:hypothetical protein